MTMVLVSPSGKMGSATTGSDSGPTGWAWLLPEYFVWTTWI